MRCKAVQKKLALYAGGELSERSARRIASHLEECAGCRREAASFRRARSALEQAASLPPELDQEDYWGRLRRRILQARWRPTPAGGWRQGLLRPLLVGAGFALILTIVLGLILASKGFLPGGPGAGERPALPQTAVLPPEWEAPDGSTAEEALPGPYQLELVTYTESREPIDL